jgi:hypothetical protein
MILIDELGILKWFQKLHGAGILSNKTFRDECRDTPIKNQYIFPHSRFYLNFGRIVP